MTILCLLTLNRLVSLPLIIIVMIMMMTTLAQDEAKVLIKHGG